MASLLHPHAVNFLPYDRDRWQYLEYQRPYSDPPDWRAALRALAGRLCECVAELPFRLDLREAPESEVRTVLRTAGRTEWLTRDRWLNREPKPQDAHALTTLISDDGRFAALAADDAETIAAHPDERVLDTLLRYRAEWLRARPALIERLARRLLERALREGVAWTPLLDRLAMMQLWPDPTPAPREDDYDAYVDRPSGLHGGMASWLRVLTAWLATASPAEAHLLLRFQSHEARLAAVLGGRELGADSVRLILRAMPFAHLLARNAALGWEGAGVLLTWTLDLVGSREPLAGAVVTFVLQHGARRALQLPPPVMARLADAIRLPTQALVGDDALQAAWLLALQRELPAEVLLIVVQRFAHENELMVEVAHHASGDLAVWRALAQRCSIPRVRRRLSEVPAARQDSEVRRILRTSRDLEVLGNLARGASPEEFVELLGRIAEKNRSTAAAILAESPEHVARVRARLERDGASGALSRLASVQAVPGSEPVPSAGETVRPLRGATTNRYEYTYDDVDDLLEDAPSSASFTLQIVEQTFGGDKGPVWLVNLFVELRGQLNDGRSLTCRLLAAEDVPCTYWRDAAPAVLQARTAGEDNARQLVARLAAYLRMGGWPAEVSSWRGSVRGAAGGTGGWRSGGVPAPVPSAAAMRDEGAGAAAL